MKRAFLWLHRWLGLGAAIVVSFLGLTGASLVFRPELDAYLNPNLLRAASKSQIAPLQPTFESIEKRFPDRKISFLFAAKAPGQTHEWWLDKGAWRVYSDPGTGQILGERGETQGLMPWLYRAHTHLFAGEVGEQIAGWSGLILGALTLSGLVLWWPRGKSGWKRAFFPQLKTNWRGVIYELHRVGGFWASGFLILTVWSGTLLIWHDLADSLAAPFGISNVKKEKGRAKVALPLDEYVRRANAAMPEGELSRVAFPSKAGAPLIVLKKLPDELHPNGQNNIALDPQSGRVLSVSRSDEAPTGQRLLNLRYPIHIGVWGGNFSRVLLVLVGLSPMGFSISGFLLWRNRNRSRAPKTSASNPKAQHPEGTVAV